MKIKNDFTVTRMKAKDHTFFRRSLRAEEFELNILFENLSVDLCASREVEICSIIGPSPSSSILFHLNFLTSIQYYVYEIQTRTFLFH